MAMSFFEHQEAARKQTGRLVVLFVLAVVAIGVAIYLLVAAVSLGAGEYQRTKLAYETRRPNLWNAQLAVGVGAATLLVVGGASLYKISQLRAGGHVVAEQLGGRLLHHNSTSGIERRLLNVVEEMAIASGIPAPPVYLLDQEEGINAFAAGLSPDDAVIGVTKGCAQILSRDQLQGVIAHEFSHILNGDMRMNLRLMGVLHGILVIGLIGYFVLRSAMWSRVATRRSREGNPLPLLAIGLGLIVIGAVGTFFGSWIKAAVSRQREFLADASAVQFTRNPDGIGGALKVIGGYKAGTAVNHPNAPTASHMFFGQAIASGLASIMATHPPLGDRIRRVLPEWDGQVAEPSAGPVDSDVRPVAGFAGGTGGAGEHRGTAVDQIGRPTPAHVAYAADLVRQIPAALAEAARGPYGARALIYALLIVDDAAVRHGQIQRLATHGERGMHAEVQRLSQHVAKLDRAAVLPLVDMTLGSLRQLTAEQYRAFMANFDALAVADEKISLFEWTLQRILRQHVRPQFEKVARRRVDYYALRPLAPHCSVLLSALAWVGSADRQAAAAAFAAGAGWLDEAQELTLVSPEGCRLGVLGEAMDALDRLAPRLKQRVLEACAACVSADRKVTVNESELLRAIADTLGCPMPPVLAGQGLV